MRSISPRVASPAGRDFVAGEIALCCLLITEEVFFALCDSIRNGAFDFARPRCHVCDRGDLPRANVLIRRGSNVKRPSSVAAGRDSVAGEVVLCCLLTEEEIFCFVRLSRR